MQISVDRQPNGLAVVHLSDHVDTTHVPMFKERVDAEFNAGTKKYVLDLSRVTFLDSTGMGSLVSVLRRARELGGDVKLVWPERETTRQLLRVIRFDKVFDIKATVEDALRDLA